jgi:UDP-N-acetylglucosamine diphosphorylase/glucosamine-1-phosphate N-acetyltransferase
MGSSIHPQTKKITGPIVLNALPDLFTYNEAKLIEDYRICTRGRVSAPIDPTCIVLGDPGLVFIEPGAQVEACFLNTRKGPIYIGSDAQVMEAAVLHGPVAILDHSAVRAGAKIYGATTVGPHCKVAGEVSNSVIFGYSNKGHEGFIGNAVLGEWCNLGADTNCSNLKNNYSEVSIWNYARGSYVNTGLTFCGLIMGDHAKCGINTMFNTGTVVGVAANVFGGGFPPKYIPSFSWGGADGFEPYERDKAIETAKKAMARRQLSLSNDEESVLRNIHDDVAVVE